MSSKQTTNGGGAGSETPLPYINRELSWLAFNGRVLAEAGDDGTPVLERLKFLAIHASNLDEFFMVRVAGLHEQLEAAVADFAPDGMTTKEQLARIREIVAHQILTASSLLTDTLIPELAKHGIRIEDWASLEPALKEQAGQYFRSSVFPILTPLAVDPGHPFPFVSHLSLSLAVEVQDPETHERKFARVKVPESLPRFLAVDHLPGGTARPHGEAAHRLLPLEQLVAAHLDQLFPGME